MSIDPANKYELGDLVTLTARFRDPVTNGLLQPSTVNFEVMDPDGNVTHPDAQFNANLETPDGITGPGFFVEVDTTPGPWGMWYYRSSSAGAGQAAQEGQFYVEKSHFSA